MKKTFPRFFNLFPILFLFLVSACSAALQSGTPGVSGAVSDQETQRQGGFDSSHSTENSDDSKVHDGGSMPGGLGGTPAFAPLSPATGPGPVGSATDPTSSGGTVIPSDPGSTSGTPPCSGPPCSALSGPIGANGDKTEGTGDGVTEKNGTSVAKIKMPKGFNYTQGIQGPGLGGIISPIDVDPAPGINTTNVKAPVPGME